MNPNPEISLLDRLLGKSWLFIWTAARCLTLAALLSDFGNDSVNAQLMVQSNRVLELDGQNSWIDFPPAAFQGLKEFTVESWIKPAQFGRKSD